MADTWLEPSTVKAVLGTAMSESVDAGPLAAVLPGVRAYVERRRSDLFVTDDEDPPVTTFEPTPDVVLGAAFLAWRLYARRKSPLGVVGATEDGYSGILREDPDIARLLGIAAGGRFVFGASKSAAERAAEAEAVV